MYYSDVLFGYYSDDIVLFGCTIRMYYSDVLFGWYHLADRCLSGIRRTYDVQYQWSNVMLYNAVP